MMYDTKMIPEDPIKAEEPEEEIERHNKQATDLYTDILRLDSILKKLHTRLKKAYNKQNDELCVKLANAIGLMSSKKVDMSCIVLKVEEIISGKTYYRPK